MLMAKYIFGTEIHMLKSITDELTEYLKKYKIVRKLGEGGMGVVYQVFDAELNRTLAVKVISPRANARISKRFLREVEITAQLDHPHIVKVYNSSLHNGKLFMIMEYIEGQTLNEYMRTNSPSIEERVKIMIQVAGAIQYAHKKGIVHRDLKPDNIIVKKDGTAYLMDFGVAKMRNSKSLTATHDTIGTPAYMSPEQANGNRDIDARSDIYSFGVIFFEVLCGQRMVDGDSTMNILFNVISEKPLLLTSVNSEIPQVLEDIWLKAVQKKKKNRYASMQEFINDLQHYLHPRNEILYFLNKTWDKNRKWCYATLLLLLVIGLAIFAKQEYQMYLLAEFNKKRQHQTSLLEKYVKEKQYDRAIEALKSLEMTEDDYNYQLADIACRMNQKEALDIYKKIKSPPQNDFLFRGKLFFVAGKYQQAVSEFEKQLQFLDEQQRDIQAHEEYKYKALQQSRYVTQEYLGEVYFLVGKYGKAIENLEETATQKGFFLLGSSYFFQKEYAKAIAPLDNAKEEYPKNYERCFRLAQCYIEEQQWQKAIPLLEICIEEQPWQGQLYQNRGQAYYALGKYHKSYDDFFKLSELDTGANNYDHGDAYIGYFLNIVVAEDDPKEHHKLAYQTIDQLKEIYSTANQDLLKLRKKKLYDSISKPQFAAFDKNAVSNFIHILKQKEYSTEIVRMAKSGLETMAYWPQVLQMLKEAKLDKVYQHISIQHEKIKTQEITYLLKRLFLLYDQRALVDLYSQDENCIVLEKILKNNKENSIIRYFSALALKKLRTLSAYRILQKNCRSKDPVTSLYCLTFTGSNTQERLNRIQKIKKTEKDIPAIALAIQNFTRDATYDQVGHLLKDENTLVRLAVANHLWLRFGDLAAGDVMLQQTLVGDKFLRRYALMRFWKPLIVHIEGIVTVDDSMYSDKFSQPLFREKAMSRLMSKFELWLNSDDELFQCFTIFVGSYANWQGSVKKAREFLAKNNDEYNKYEFLLLSAIKRQGNLMECLSYAKRDNASWMSQILFLGSFHNLIHHPLSLVENVSKVNSIKVGPDSKKQRFGFIRSLLFKSVPQAVIMLKLPEMMVNMVQQVMVPIFLENLKREDMYLRISAIEGLGVLPGNYEKQINSVLQEEKSPKVKKVAAFSLIRHVATRKDSISVLQENLDRYHKRFLEDPTLRKAAAWGYSSASSGKTMRFELGINTLEYRQQVFASYREVENLGYCKFLLSKALELAPGDIDYLFEMVVICYLQKEYTDSLDYINKILDKSEDDYYLRWKASILFELRKFAACREALEQGLKINPWNTRLLGLKVQVLEKLGSKEVEKVRRRLQLFAK